MIRLPNLLPRPTDAATTKTADAAAAKAGETPPKVRADATPAPGADTTTAASGRRELARLRATFERSALQDQAVAAADVALDGLGKQRETLGAMRALAVEATGADFTSAFAAGKGLRTDFDALSARLEATSEATRSATLVLADVPSSSSFATRANDLPAMPALPDMGPRGLGLAGVSFGSRQDAATAVKAVDVALERVDASEKDVFQFREGVSKVAEADRREAFNGGLLRNREEALAMAGQVSKSLSQEGADGQTFGAQLLAQSIPSAQAVLSLLRSE